MSGPNRILSVNRRSGRLYLYASNKQKSGLENISIGDSVSFFFCMNCSMYHDGVIYIIRFYKTSRRFHHVIHCSTHRLLGLLIPKAIMMFLSTVRRRGAWVFVGWPHDDFLGRFLANELVDPDPSHTRRSRQSPWSDREFCAYLRLWFGVIVENIASNQQYERHNKITHQECGMLGWVVLKRNWAGSVRQWTRWINAQVYVAVVEWKAARVRGTTYNLIEWKNSRMGGK